MQDILVQESWHLHTVGSSDHFALLFFLIGYVLVKGIPI